MSFNRIYFNSKPTVIKYDRWITLNSRHRFESREFKTGTKSHSLRRLV